MDGVVSQFLSKGTAIIAIVVVICGFFTKRTVEMIWPNLRPIANEMAHKPMYKTKASLWWNQIGLYALPVVLGAMIGVVAKEEFLYGPDIKTTSGRVFYAACVGWFADFLYEVVQKALLKSTGVSLPNPDDRVASISPPSNSPGPRA
jgi:hypothetical protein